MAPRLGFIGLGLMGKPMAARLLDAGYPVAVHNRSQGAVHELVARGAVACTSSQEVAARSDVVLTMLPDTPDVELVLLGDRGVAEGIAAGSVIIDMTTNNPEDSARLAAHFQARQVVMLDAPVSGGDVEARHGTLSIMVGGPRETFAACEPILKVLGHKIVHAGPRVGMGGHAKLANQILVAITLAGMGEALVYGTKAGIDPALLVEAMSAGLARCGVLDIKAPKVLAGDFKPGGKVDAQVQDLHHAMQMARQLRLSLPVTAVVNELFHAVQNAGRGDWDHSAIITLVEEFAGVTARSLLR
ncbi:MAG: 2-hydroxy-3-oxopropionate reductase [Candidatus Tectomicrobia bacterium]|uniref:2-hydroxy-3-oxopropionate reductase n=1 Tax=Tectimicrobiota bacterium TaxID=2528274 RepID=A0A937W4C3_UNCTE|nr:2-hydroxy-3-oxopropionate reductase [Candidatus Tectomicrobia bacterium]